MRVGVRRNSPAGAFDLEEVEEGAFQGAQSVSSTCACVKDLAYEREAIGMYAAAC